MTEMLRQRNDACATYLRRATVLDMQIDAAFERIQQLRALAERRTAAYGREKVGGSGAADRRMDVVARIVDAERELDAQIDHMLALREEIREVIGRVPDDRMRVLLELRYLNGHTWEVIAEEMNYTTRNIYNLHGAALKVVAPLIAAAEAGMEKAG